ncbi:MAG: tetratricopeptide repeat protein, partial [Lentisphaerae bacterium]|nr:tetratricopeptide repeat protein [Lentisphaerota bacterium]
CLCMLGTSLAVLLVLCVFAVDVYFRNYGRLLREMFPEAADDDDPLVWRAMRSFRLSVKVLRPLMRIEPFVAIALVVPFRFDGTVREMASIVNDIVRQTAAECDGANMLFTDGSLDAAEEVAAKLRGSNLKALSMMSRSGKYDVAVRLRGETNEENRVLLSVGAADALRTWVKTKNPCVSNIALQVGLELWRRNNLPMPEAGGLVSRTAGFPGGKAEPYAESARSIAERILRLYANGDPMDAGYPELNSLFLFGQWRLSRMCRMRANEADGRKDAKASEMEHSLADRLDRFNPEWQKVQERMDWIGKQDGMRLTPREGLKLGLERADFRLARSYARKVIVSDADDVQANFALGMGYFTEKQYGRAEMHLRKCLVRAPNEPAVLNNLAIVLLRLGRFDEAEANALQALKHLPDSSEIKITLRHIRTAKGRRPKEPSRE